ncbi:MAG: hypothetical protein AAF433_09300 [Bacteroidota bacterium]
MRPYVLLWGLLVSLSIPLNASSIFDLIKSKAEVRELRLELPMDSILAKTNNDQAATISFTDDTDLAQRWSLKVGVRGKFRRRTCALPPLRLDFDKSELEDAGLARHDKLKLVVPCLDGQDGETLLLREYLAYQVYERLTPYHFRTQLLQLTLVDSDGRLPDQTVYAFVLEDTDEMAERIGGEEIDGVVSRVARDWNRNAEVMHSLAQYLLGNHDFSLTMVRNLKQVRMYNDGLLVPVAYDFDFSYLVGAPYATLNSSVGQERFGDRVYLGFKMEDAVLIRSLQHFANQRRAVLRYVRNYELLDFDERYALADRLISGFNQLRRVHRDADKHEDLYVDLRGKHHDTLPAGELPENYGLSRR